MSEAVITEVVHRLSDNEDYWTLVLGSKAIAKVHCEVGRLLIKRPAEALDVEMQALYAEDTKIGGLYELTFSLR